MLRLLAKERDELVLENLGMEADHLVLFRSWFQTSNGIVLVTGPDRLRQVHHPSPRRFRRWTTASRRSSRWRTRSSTRCRASPQIQTHAEIGFTFARALRAILRQDPDVIMIGEIRDLETAEIAIRSAMTGHIVLSTVHTNDALSSFTRPHRHGGWNPSWWRRRYAACRRSAWSARPVGAARGAPPRPRKVREQLAHLPPELVGDHWVEVRGCEACRHTGYRGRTGIYELVPVSGELQDGIVAGARLGDLRKLALEQGHRTLMQDGLIKASHGQTTLEEVTRLTLEE